MKKIVSLLLVLSMALSLCACGSNQKAPSKSSTSEKGTRTNPYKLGDAIKFKARPNRNDDSNNTSGTILNVSVMFSKSYYGDEVKALYDKNNITSNAYPSQLLPFTVSVSGDYDESIFAENLFLISGLTKEMIEDSTIGCLADSKLDSFYNLYTGVEYSLYRQMGLFGDDKYDLATITYKDGENKNQTIWVDIR